MTRKLIAKRVEFADNEAQFDLVSGEPLQFFSQDIIDLEEAVGSISVPQATTTVAGIAELATDAETITGTDAARTVTPEGLQAKLDTYLDVIAFKTGINGNALGQTTLDFISGRSFLNYVPGAVLVKRNTGTFGNGKVEIWLNGESVTGEVFLLNLAADSNKRAMLPFTLICYYSTNSIVQANVTIVAGSVATFDVYLLGYRVI